jgi:UDP-glucose 4-epimerase
VFKSSAHAYGASRDDPAFFTEDMTRTRHARTRIERDIVEAEHAVLDFA